METRYLRQLKLICPFDNKTCWKYIFVFGVLKIDSTEEANFTKGLKLQKINTAVL